MEKYINGQPNNEYIKQLFIDNNITESHQAVSLLREQYGAGMHPLKAVVIFNNINLEG